MTARRPPGRPFDGPEAQVRHARFRAWALGCRVCAIPFAAHRLGPQLVEDNQVEIVLNGDQISASMLSAIRSAKKTITFVTCIDWSDDIGRKFVEALIERASSGVKVHVLLDWVGSAKIGDALLAPMKDSGAQVERFHEPDWKYWNKGKNRTHRRLLVVDGRVGFTGAVGIADLRRGLARNPDEWRDSHFNVEGPVVAQMQSVFHHGGQPVWRAMTAPRTLEW